MGIGCLRVWRRNLESWRKYYKASLVGVLGEPLLYLLALGYGLGRFVPQVQGMSYVEFLAPGILASAAMNSASFETTFGSFTRMTEQKTYEAIVVTPVSLGEIVAGDILWGATKSAISGVAILAVMALFGLVKSLWAFFVLPLTLVMGTMFGAMGMVATAKAPSYDFFNYYFTMVISVMFLFSGVFFPLSSLPAWGQRVAWFLPLTHAVGSCRALVLGQASWGILADVLWMVLFAVGIFAVAVRLVKRRLII